MTDCHDLRRGGKGDEGGRERGVAALAAAAAAAAIIDRLIYVTRHGTGRISGSDDTERSQN